MSERSQPESGETPFSRLVGARETRRMRAQRHATRSIWFGFATFGLIGWSVAVPTLLGAALGLWLDNHYPGKHSWTLALLSIGLVLGCWIAWYWVAKENREIRAEQEEENE